MTPAGAVPRDSDLGMPVLGMAGWGVADPAGGDYLSDGLPTAGAAIDTAYEVLSLMRRGVDGDLARMVAAQIAHAKWGEYGS